MRFVVTFILLMALKMSAANLVPNSSFECSAGRGWATENSDQTLDLLRDRLTNGGFHGTYCMTIPKERVLISPCLYLTASVTYTFSWYEKGNEANTAHWDIWPTSNGGPDGSAGANITMPTSWTRRSVQYTPASTGYYNWGFYHNQGTLLALIDAIQVEVGGSATAYAPQATVEASLSTSTDHNTFFTGDTKQVNINWWNDGASTPRTLYYEIFDIFNRKVASGGIHATLASGATTSTLSLPAVNGWQRITSRILRLNNSGDELTVAIMPFAAGSGKVTAGILGSTTQNDAGEIAYLRKLGFTWTRTLSPSRVFRWQDLEQTDNVYTWNDAGVTTISGGDLMVLGVLQGGLDFTGGPDWAMNLDGSMKLDKWVRFCSNVVHRYKSQVSYWEIWNEPQQSGTAWIMSAANYCDMLTNAAAKIKTEDSSSKVIAMGGVIDNAWALSVWNRMSSASKAQIDYVSCHLYPNDNSSDQNYPEYDSRQADWYSAFGGILPIWNTETGTWGFGGMLTENAIWGFSYSTASDWSGAEAMIRSRVSVDRITRNFIRSLGNHFVKYIYYDARSWSRAAVASTQPYSWEYTYTPRPTIAALAVANGYLDQYTSVSKVVNGNDANVEIYLFEMGSSRVAAIFNTDRVTKDIAVSQTDFVVYDVMGNAVTQPSGKIRVTKTPQYVVSSGLNLAAMTTMLQGSVSAIADTTAPAVSIDIAPSGFGSSTAAFIKWTGIDREVVNTTTYPDNIQFAWQLDRNGYSVYSETNYIRLNVSTGSHVFWVKAKDSTGNISETSRSFDLFAPTNVH